MIKQIYNEEALPLSDLAKIGLADEHGPKLDKEDLALLLAGRRTQMLRLENLMSDGLRIQQLDAKLSLKPSPQGDLELLVHPIYRQTQDLSFLTVSETEKLEKGKVENIEKTIFDDEGNLKDVLIEFDQETNEFIVTDEARILAPDRINGQYLSLDQKEKYRKGKEVELADGTKVRFSATDKNGIKANKLMLVASLLMDGGLSFILFKGLHWHFVDRKQQKNTEAYSKGYYQDLGEYEKQQQQRQGEKPAQQPAHQQERSYSRSGPETMNPYLTHLGIRPEIQEWLAPHYFTNDAGHLCFAYQKDTEVFGLGFHRVPLSGHWQTENPLARQTVICSSAMEAIAWLNCHSAKLDELQMIAGEQQQLSQCKQVLVFGNDLPGRVNDLKIAAKLNGHVAEVWYANDNLQINFRNQCYQMPAETFSLSAFERLSGFRFGVKTSKPARHSSWLHQLLNE